MKNKMKRWMIILLALAGWTTSAFALVETDNHLLGALKKQGFNVVQDLGEIMAKKQGLPALKIMDHTPTEYVVSSRLNTMMFSGTHVRGLHSYASANNGNDGFDLDADTAGRWILVTWRMPMGRSGAHYAKQLNDWKTNITALNADIIRQMEIVGEDKAVAPESTHKNGDVETFDLGHGVKLDMVYVEPGTFMMGSPMSEAGRRENETQHHVTLSQGYWIGKYEVTQEQWGAIMGNNPSKFKGARNPVESVSWDACQSFIEKLNARIADKGFSLPTEAEWEFAARGGTQSRGYLYSGGNDLNGCGWYTGNSGKTTHNVGQKTANELGLHDMSGNVWEWCADWYGHYSVLAQVDPHGGASGSYRVRRGGSWYYGARYCRVAYRGNGYPNNSSYIRGFRLARSTGR